MAGEAPKDPLALSSSPGPSTPSQTRQIHRTRVAYKGKDVSTDISKLETSPDSTLAAQAKRHIKALGGKSRQKEAFWTPPALKSRPARASKATTDGGAHNKDVNLSVEAADGSSGAANTGEAAPTRESRRLRAPRSRPTEESEPEHAGFSFVYENPSGDPGEQVTALQEQKQSNPFIFGSSNPSFSTSQPRQSHLPNLYGGGSSTYSTQFSPFPSLNNPPFSIPTQFTQQAHPPSTSIPAKYCLPSGQPPKLRKNHVSVIPSDHPKLGEPLPGVTPTLPPLGSLYPINGHLLRRENVPGKEDGPLLKSAFQKWLASPDGIGVSPYGVPGVSESEILAKLPFVVEGYGSEDLETGEGVVSWMSFEEFLSYSENCVCCKKYVRDDGTLVEQVEEEEEDGVQEMVDDNDDDDDDDDDEEGESVMDDEEEEDDDNDDEVEEYSGLITDPDEFIKFLSKESYDHTMTEMDRLMGEHMAKLKIEEAEQEKLAEERRVANEAAAKLRKEREAKMATMPKKRVALKDVKMGDNGMDKERKIDKGKGKEDARAAPEAPANGRGGFGEYVAPRAGRPKKDAGAYTAPKVGRPRKQQEKKNIDQTKKATKEKNDGKIEASAVEKADVEMLDAVDITQHNKATTTLKHTADRGSLVETRKNIKPQASVKKVDDNSEPQTTRRPTKNLPQAPKKRVSLADLALKKTSQPAPKTQASPSASQTE